MSGVNSQAGQPARTTNFKHTGLEIADPSKYDVRVHQAANKPAALQAHAYAQGNKIHLGAGQEGHLPHESWHVAQQK